MWQMQTTEQYERQHKRYEKKHKRELSAVLNNLDTLVNTLNTLGGKVQQWTFGFIHTEPHGILAIDQKGGGKSLAETRLYVFPDEDKQVVYLLAIGDKRTQAKDIQTCTNYVLDLRKQKQDTEKNKESPNEGAAEKATNEDDQWDQWTYAEKAEFGSVNDDYEAGQHLVVVYKKDGLMEVWTTIDCASKMPEAEWFDHALGQIREHYQKLGISVESILTGTIDCTGWKRIREHPLYSQLKSRIMKEEEFGE